MLYQGDGRQTFQSVQPLDEDQRTFNKKKKTILSSFLKDKFS